jgi:hypothetical protein
MKKSLSKNISGLVILLSALLISSCNNESSGGEVDSLEVWYLTQANVYLTIDSTGDVRSYECSVSDGYVQETDVSGQLIGNQMVISNSGSEDLIYTVELGENQRLVHEEYEVPFEVAFEVPSTCNDDAIEITYFSPEEAPEGIETEFLLNFDYRVASSENMIIEIGFTFDQDGGFVLTNDELEVSSLGVSSGTLTAHYVPEIFENSEPFKMYVVMYQARDNSGRFSPTASDEVLINVIPE